MKIKDEQIKSLLKHFKIRQIDIAKAVGCDPALVSRVLRGKIKRAKMHKQDKIITATKAIILSRIEQLQKEIKQFQNEEDLNNKING